MARIYRIMFEDVAVAAAQDLIQITGAAGKIVRIKHWWWGATNTTAPTNQQIKTRCRFLPATVTNGSGGTTPTISKNDPGDATASLTALVNNTTKATTSGTAIVLDEGGDNIFSGRDIITPNPPVIGPSEAFVFELLSTPTGTVNMSGGVEVEEIGG